MTPRILAATLVVAAGVSTVPTGLAQTRPGAGGAEQNKVLLDLLNQVENSGRQLRELRGHVEDSSNRIDQLNDRIQKSEKRQGDLYNDTDARLRRVEQVAKDDVAERKKLVQQITDLDLRIRKLEADIEVQFKKLEADHRRTDTGPGAAPAGDLEARLKRLEQPASPTRAEADLDARIRRLEAALGAAGASGHAQSGSTEPPPGAATAVVAPPAKVPVTPSAGTTASPPAPTGTPVASLDPQSVGRSYDQALAKQRAGDAAGAVQGFQTFLKLYPRHELAPNAQYWLGEAYYRMGDYPNAIAAQQKLLVTYPDHLKVPDAMLILANSHSAQGETQLARRTLEDIATKHPLSEAAEKARQRLGKPR